VCVCQKRWDLLEIIRDYTHYIRRRNENDEKSFATIGI